MYKPFIPNWFDDMALDPYVFRVLCHIIRSGTCKCKVKTLSSKLNMGEHKVRSCIKTLENKGIISIEKHRGKANVYHLNEFEKWNIPTISNGQMPK